MRERALTYAMGLLLLTPGVKAQELMPSALKLEKVIPVQSVPGGAVLNPIKCDGRGNIYVRMDHPKVFDSPVLKIAPDGEKKAVFSTEHAEGWEEAEVYDFALQPDGDLFLLAARPGEGRTIEHVVLSFSDQGKFREAIPLKSDFTSADHLAVFSTGEFMVSGWKKPPKFEGQGAARTAQGGEPEVEAQTVIFDRNGNFLRNAELSMDLGTTPESRKTRNPLLLPASAISLGAAVPGDSGEVFILFRGNRPTVFAIPAKGNVVSKIEIMPPAADAVALSLGYASGIGLVVQFALKTVRNSFDTARSVISIVDPQTGERLHDFQSSPEAGGAFACRSTAGFLFLTTQKDGYLAIRRSVPR